MCFLYHLGQVTVVGGGVQRGEGEARLAAGEGGRRLDEGRSVTEGAEPPLLGEELLVGHGVDGMGEGERRAEVAKQTSDLLISRPFQGKMIPTLAGRQKYHSSCW